LFDAFNNKLAESRELIADLFPVSSSCGQLQNIRLSSDWANPFERKSELAGGW
jgi:hypothetical protein